MKKYYYFLLFFSSIVLIQSCASPKYFHDELSYERQKELQGCRSNNIFCDVAAGIGSMIFAVATDTDIGYVPSNQQFKKLKLMNTSTDTIYVNMLTDLVWDDDDYCDFMDIRIPPNLDCKVLVPIAANYNLYFSNTPESNDDEMLEINTSDLKQVALYPGLTILSDSGKN